MIREVVASQAWVGSTIVRWRLTPEVPSGVRLLILSLGFMLVGAGTALAQSTDAYYYIYRGQEISLEVEDALIMVIDRERRPLRAVEEYLHAVGMSEFNASGYIKDAMVFKRALAGPARPASEIIAELAGRPDNPFFLSPTFKLGNGFGFLAKTVAVAFHEDISRSNALSLIQAVGNADVVVENYGGTSNVYLIAPRSRSGIEVLESANRLALLPETVWGDPLMISTTATPSSEDPLYIDSWHLHNPLDTVAGNSDGAVDINAPQAWSLTTGSADVKLMILDDGFDKSHEDLSVAVGLDCTQGTSNEIPSPCRCDQADPAICDPAKTLFDPNAGSHVYDWEWHGTPVAGFAGATINNGVGSVGVAPNVSLIAARTFVGGAWDPRDLVSALGWAIDSGVRVVNISWNDSVRTSSGEAWMYDLARASGILIVSSAGNDGSDRAYWPALYGSVMAVSGVSADGSRWVSQPGFESNFGPQIIVAAPSIGIWSTDRSGASLPDPPISEVVCQSSGDYCTFAGTSFAAPIVAGIAALVVSINPDLTPAQVESIICAEAHGGGGPGVDWIYGCGVVDAEGAVEAALAGRIFVDGFESGSFSAWSSVVGNV